MQLFLIEGYEKGIKENLNKYGKELEDSLLSVHIIKIDDDYYCVDYSVEELGRTEEARRHFFT